jgi:hypothetical protein
MARIRTIQPTFARSPSMKRISRDARLLFVLIWTVVDDEGRCHADPDDLARVLFPEDFDAPRYMHGWLDELENEGCIERYEVDEIDYLRVAHWHKHQRVYHPTRSHLPPSPHERLSGSGIRESSGADCMRGRKMQRDQQLETESEVFPESSGEKDDAPIVVTEQTLLRDLRRLQRSAEAAGALPSAVRTIELTARIGLEKKGAAHAESRDEDYVGPSPAVLMGLPPNGRDR